MDHYVLCSSQDHLRTGIYDLDHPILADAENTDTYPEHLCHDILKGALLSVLPECPVGPQARIFSLAAHENHARVQQPT
jgi:hypothetical protein